jgi:uncharacterized phage protein (TIGR01671 family)
MREIKFRAWKATDDYGNGKMLTHEHENQAGDLLNEAFSAGMPIMQYTGLQDKNGVEIYEGDVVTGASNTFRVDPAVVKYGLGYFGAATSDDVPDDQLIPLNPKSPFGANFLEVIGNIYEEPGTSRGRTTNGL